MSGKTIAEVLTEHQKVSMGMTYGSPDGCRCGEQVYPERGDTEVTLRRDVAFAAHQATALEAAGYGGPCEAARINKQALYLLENEWGGGHIDVGKMQRVLRGDEPDVCPTAPEPADAKFLRGERKSLLKLIDGWEREGHTTVTIRFLRQHLTKKEPRK